ncbi:ADP-ribosylglycohydrolase [Kribbella voronezhensis]|uniref:ADP-ribosylglycohydrolase n=1 Tax=Kribbella voronezhensis TaxID=2512212 RepID=A0A4R7SVP9_9ACTN|nr:ADP-ribosylglycohydrolase family protein [Kribbella voronezhensis]TDU83251.1 ADP-ribosylglycohydrolase [Kribbella voronezhensis]
MRLTWVQPEDLLPHQLVQSRAEGVDVTDIESRWRDAGGTTEAPVSGASDKPAPPVLRTLARELLDELDTRTPEWTPPQIPQLPLLGDAASATRAGWAGGKALGRGADSPGSASLRSPGLDGRVLGAWVGRAAGNLLGKPVEKIPREGIREILQSSGQWPLGRYVTAVGVPDEVQQRWPWNRRSKPISLREVIDGMPEDDDLNFAILALQLVERHGDGLTTEDVATAWLNDLPAGRVFTAERVAYRNLLEGVEPERAAVIRNPFREWIGAQIRTDVYGWVHPGDRTAAARLALTDARLSHTGAGVDGAIWVAAMSAAALVLDDPREVALAGLEAIAPDGEIARAVRFGLALADDPLDDALDRLHAEYGHLHWVHSVNNSALTAYALTAPDFATGIGRAVMGGWDTDSAGATTGAVLGAVLGVPAEWAGPLDDRLATSLPGMNQVAISELAARTVEAASMVGERG